MNTFLKFRLTKQHISTEQHASTNIYTYMYINTCVPFLLPRWNYTAYINENTSRTVVVGPVPSIAKANPGISSYFSNIFH